MTDSKPRRVTPEIERCDCGGEFPCGHGSFLVAVHLDDVKPDWSDGHHPGEPVPEWARSYSDVSEFPEWLATLLALSPELAANLRRCVESLEDFVRDHRDPGAEAYGAVFCARAILGRLDKHLTGTVDDGPSEAKDSVAAVGLLAKLKAQADVVLGTYGPHRPDMVGRRFLGLDDSMVDLSDEEAALFERIW